MSFKLEVSEKVSKVITGITGLWWQVFIVTLLFDPLSDLPTTAKQNLPKCRIVHLLIGNVSRV